MLNNSQFDASADIVPNTCARHASADSASKPNAIFSPAVSRSPRSRTEHLRLSVRSTVRRADAVAFLCPGRKPGQTADGGYAATRLFVNSGNGWAFLNVVFLLVLAEIVFMCLFSLLGSGVICFKKVVVSKYARRRDRFYFGKDINQPSC